MRMARAGVDEAVGKAHEGTDAEEEDEDIEVAIKREGQGEDGKGRVAVGHDEGKFLQPMRGLGQALVGVGPEGIGEDGQDGEGDEAAEGGEEGEAHFITPSDSDSGSTLANKLYWVRL